LYRKKRPVKITKFVNEILNRICYETNGVKGKLQIALFITCLSIGNANADSDDVDDFLRYSLLLGASGISYSKGDTAGLRQFAWSLGITSASTLAIKQMVDAERPNGEDLDSFPSGHAATAFSAAAYLQTRYGWRLGLPAGVAASWVSVNRVNGRHHEWSDVLAGAALAVVVNNAKVLPYTGHSFTITMRYDSTGILMEGRWRF